MIDSLTAHRSPLTAHRLMVSVIIVALALSACGTPSEELPVIHREPRAASSASGSLHQTSTGSRIQYAPYAPASIVGRRSVLFFAKDTDPFSKMSDQRLRMLYGSGAAIVSTYRVPFNESAELQLKYGVFVEDTFVLVGTGAERLSLIIHPSEMELKKLVGSTNNEPLAD